jgi:prophage regulatory protein
MSEQQEPFMRIIRLKEVIESTGLARSTIYKYIAEETFPKPVSLGERSVGWVESEVHDWILARIEERDLTVAAPIRPGQMGVVV